MSIDQVHLAAQIIAAFSASVCFLQSFYNKAVHWLWLLLLLVGMVGWAVTR